MSKPACGQDFGGFFDGMIGIFCKRVVTQSQGPSNPSFGTRNRHLTFGPRFFGKDLYCRINDFTAKATHDAHSKEKGMQTQVGKTS